MASGAEARRPLRCRGRDASDGRSAFEGRRSSVAADAAFDVSRDGTGEDDLERIASDSAISGGIVDSLDGLLSLLGASGRPAVLSGSRM